LTPFLGAAEIADFAARNSCRDLAFSLGPSLGRRGAGPCPSCNGRKTARRFDVIDSRGLHSTWIDPKRPGAKLTIADPDSGEVLSAKKMRGHKAGGFHSAGAGRKQSINRW
jgi:hypothetical protein